MNNVWSLCRYHFSLKTTPKSLCKSPSLVFVDFFFLSSPVTLILSQRVVRLVLELSPVVTGCVGGSASFLQWKESELSQLWSKSVIHGVMQIKICKALSPLRSLLAFSLPTFSPFRRSLIVTKLQTQMWQEGPTSSKAVTAHSSVGKCEGKVKTNSKGRYQGRGLNESWILLCH